MLRWRLFGIDFAIEPSFWYMNALWAFILFGPLTGRGGIDGFLLIFILIWIACSFLSTMVHELGHAVMGRIFGQPGSITLKGFGGDTVGAYEKLGPWKRIVVIICGPFAGFALVALVLMLDSGPWNHFMDHIMRESGSNWWDGLKFRTAWIDHLGLGAWRRDQYLPYVITMSILTFTVFYTNALNLLPIIPMDGGMILKEIFCMISPAHGLRGAFIVSIAAAVIMTLLFAIITLENFEYLEKRISGYYPFGYPIFTLIVFASLAWRCWRSYGELVAAERRQMFKEHYDDAEYEDVGEVRPTPPYPEEDRYEDRPRRR